MEPLEFVKGLTIAAAGQLTDYAALERHIESIPLTKESSIRLIALERLLKDKTSKAKEYLTNRTADTGSYVDKGFGISLTVRDKKRVNIDTDETRELAEEIKAEAESVKLALTLAMKDKQFGKKIQRRIDKEKSLLDEGETLDINAITHEETIKYLRDTFPGLEVKTTEYREWTVKSIAANGVVKK